MADVANVTINSGNATKIILITGINGFIASHIALQLLQKGYTVRGTSRSHHTLSKLRSQPSFTAFPANQLQHAYVPDFTAPHAFRDAVRDVHAIIHTASPLDFKLTSVDAFFGPAVTGVTNLMGSVWEENLRVAKRNGKEGSQGNGKGIISFVLTSSISAVADRWRFPPISAGGTENRAYTEDDWNESGEKVARESEGAGRMFLPMVAYGASKAAAERAMWGVAKGWKSEHVGTSVTAPACSSICPGVTTGPPVNWPDSPDKLSETVKPVWDIWSGLSKQQGVLPPQIGGANYIDVRDVARIHVWCMENPNKSRGQRYLMTNGKAPPQGTADVLRDVLYKDDEKVTERIIVGEPGKGWVEGFGWPDDEPTTKATKAMSALCVERFIGFEQSIGDTVEAFRERWPEYGL